MCTILVKCILFLRLISYPALVRQSFGCMKCICIYIGNRGKEGPSSVAPRETSEVKAAGMPVPSIERDRVLCDGTTIEQGELNV